MSRGHSWRLEPHVCRVCFGRIASRPADGDEDTDRRVYSCTNCGAEAEGNRASVVCACGTKIRSGASKGRLIDAGLRCHENRARSMEFPSLYVASHAGAQTEE